MARALRRAHDRVDSPQPVRQSVPTGAVLVHHLQLSDSKPPRFLTRTVDRTRGSSSIARHLRDRTAKQFKLIRSLPQIHHLRQLGPALALA